MEINAQYNSKDTEGKISKLWQDNGVFNAEVSDKIPYTIMIPPPNITGILHMGHALNNTIQDVLIRYKRMKGFEVLWMPGTDHAGIATQNVVEKQLAKEGLGKEDLGREAFVKRLWDWRRDYGSTILNQLEKLGASCDWRRTRFTMDEAYSDAVKEVFVHLYDKGLIYRGNYIINWCPRCKTALSDEEAAHREIDGFLYYIKYPVQKNKSSDKDFVVVATTRPETMLGDTGLAINPNDQKNSWLKDATVVLPIMNRTLKVVVDEAIDPEFGTGIVKVTPAHDPVDFILGKKHRLDFINIMGPDAVLNDAAGEFSGMDRFKARKLLLERLDREGLLLKKEPYLISAGHCYRCDTIVEPRLSLQWFVKMKPLAKEACRVVEEDKVTFSPQRWKKVYLNWMYNIQDWCISRQIWWGHRLPVYYCPDCQAKADDDHRGIIVSKTQPEVCPECQSNRVYQDPDVLDTWFSS
ncbi:MAG: valine--tRNA ligase, partial [Candidatus Omnitrophica bacterium]|nr:valine--tRNA ligase [Candidatus Omnitrophota bacterium]